MDIPIQAGLGRFFAARFRAGVLYALYQRSGYRPALDAAIKWNRSARSAWVEFAQRAKSPYLPDITYGPEFFQRGQWLDRLPAIDRDTAELEKLLKQSPVEAQKTDTEVIKQAVQAVLNKSQAEERPVLTDLHTPPASFQRGNPLPVVARAGSSVPINGLHLRYRHVNQAELWQSVEMQRTGDDYQAVIAAEYTDSPFPVQYYFQIQTGSGKAWLYPGLEHRWHGQPYFFVRQV